MEIFLVLLAGLLIGGITIWFIRKLIFEKNFIDKNFFEILEKEKDKLESEKEFLNEKLNVATDDLSTTKKEIEEMRVAKEQLISRQSELKTRLENSDVEIQNIKDEFLELKNVVDKKDSNFNELQNKKVNLEANNNYLKEKLETQRKEIEEIGKKFSNEFKVLANQILEDKSKKFTELNQNNIEKLLDPLGKNISEFKKKVEETYDKESKQRFSLEERIKELSKLNLKISEEANNLTKALKGDSKKQGNWGEMILENILERSGLVKNREYFIQEFLRDDDGQTIKDESGRKMQPDVIVNYPDNRKIIIDSKVSLTAYERYSNADDKITQEKELKDHIQSIKNHIDNLSSKNYQDHTASLDFVMLFIPIEPAYLTAIQADQSLWDYAYKKRILLISPTNLIAALKMLADLWKREYQNQNAIEIAERGGRLYDKFVNFVESLESVGNHIDKSKKSYTEAISQLKDGSGNLVGQVEKLKKLGVKATKSIPGKLLDGGLK
ncbi:MAG: DNA recombination protein RmuC [Bacteroidota bacterium]|nr:DNA recombination protein RmuC [Bacteroidota bacterium]